MKPAYIALGLAGLLGIVLVVKLYSAPDTFGDNLGRFAWSAMVVTLVGSGVLHHYRGDGGVAIRNLLIWLAIIGAVALIYANRASLAL